MGFEFTVAIVPNNKNLSRELQYIKSALLYADKVRLISPLAYMFAQLTDERNKADEKTATYLMMQILPLAKLADVDFYNQSKPILEGFSSIINSKRFRSLPMVQKLNVKKQLKEFAVQINDVMLETIGIEPCSELTSLIRSGQVILEKFSSSLGDIGICIADYFKLLNRATKSSYPLFDEQSNDLMRAAVNERLINLTATEKLRITHAGLADNYIQRLPSFEQATIDEIIDIKKELSSPVVRFRSKMISYSETIRSLPWDNDFAPECSLLFDKEVAPIVLEIEEATRENNFVKNLGRKFFTEEGAWKTTGGLVISIAAAGVLPTFTNIAAADTAAIVAGGSIAATKISKAYEEYGQKKREIQKNDLFFYYKAGKLLEK